MMPLRSKIKVEFLFSMFVTCLLGFADSTASSTVCPAECKCEIGADDSIAAWCVSKHPQSTIDHLSHQTSHLHIFLSHDVVFSSLLTFSNLPELRFLLLDSLERYTQKHLVTISNASFLNNANLEVFSSRVRLTWGEDYSVFSQLLNLTEINLSYVRGGWNDLKRVAIQSLSDKRKLTKLYLKSFCEVGHSKWTVRESFCVNSIFGGMSGCKIRELDISNNQLHYIANNWPGSFLHLEYLDISYNMLFNPPYEGSFYIYENIFGPLIFLPELKTYNCGHQGVFAPYKSFSNENSRNSGINILKSTSKSKEFQQNILHARYKHSTAPNNNSNNIADDKSKPSTASTNNQDSRIFTTCGGESYYIPLGNARAIMLPSLLPHNFPIYTQNQKYSCIKFTTPNHLEYLDMQDSADLSILALNGLENLVFLNLNKLTTINLQRVGAYSFEETFFSHFPSLEVVLLGGNQLGASLQNSSYFARNSKLSVLDLASNEVELIPEDFFNGMSMLTHLNISGNLIANWNANITGLSNLMLFNASHNKFSNLSESFRTQLQQLSDWHHNDSTSKPNENLVIDLQDNPFSCLCQDISSVEWIQNTKVELYNKESYTCMHPAHGPVKLMRVDLEKLKQYCFPDMRRIYIISATTSSLITLFIVLTVTLYCKRWHIRYWLYLLRKGWSEYNRKQDETEYEFDVFVAHSREDEDWVTGPLYDELEVKRGFRLCFYQRDILPNEVLVDAIVDRIDKSRHTLLVLSPNFVASNWCHFEMNIAHVKWPDEGKDMIFPVILKPLSPFSVNRTLHYLLRTRVYLEWPTDPLMQPLFWQRLATALQSPDQRARSINENSVLNNGSLNGEE